MVLSAENLKEEIQTLIRLLNQGEKIVITEKGQIIGEIRPASDKKNKTPALHKLKGILKGAEGNLEQIRGERIKEKHGFIP